MAELDINPYHQYVVADKEKEFSFRFELDKDDELKVIRESKGVISDLALNQDYRVNYNKDKIIVSKKLLKGDVITLMRNTETYRPEDFQRGRPLTAAALNHQLDRLTLMAQDRERDASTSIRLDPGLPDKLDTKLPKPIDGGIIEVNEDPLGSKRWKLSFVKKPTGGGGGGGVSIDPAAIDREIAKYVAGQNLVTDNNLPQKVLLPDVQAAILTYAGKGDQTPAVDVDKRVRELVPDDAQIRAKIIALIKSEASAPAAGSTPVGAIMDYYGATVPVGWLICDGSTIDRSVNAAYGNLIEAITGNATALSATLPDFRGRVALGTGAGAGFNETLGNTGGQKTVTQTAAQMPSHGHVYYEAYVGSLGRNPTASGWLKQDGVSPATRGGTTRAAGGGQPMPNDQPWVAVNKIIKY